MEEEMETNNSGNLHDGEVGAKNDVIMATNEDKPIQCLFCELKFESEDIYKQHLQMHTGEKIYDCKFCSRSFSRNATLKKHEISCVLQNFPDTDKMDVPEVTPKKISKSKVPPKKLSHVLPRKTSQTAKVAPKKISCNVAKAAASHGLFQCDVCPSRSFQNGLALSNHMRMHENGAAKPYGCKLCPQRFSTWKQLKFHLREVHEEVPRQSGGATKLLYQCGDCKETFYDYELLKAHVTNIRNQHVEHPAISTSSFYTCIQCRKWYPTIARLHEHVKTHLRSMEYEEFMKSYPTSTTITKEVKVHKLKGKVACEICYERFATFGIYKLHMRRHAVEKARIAVVDKSLYQCMDCKKKFVEYVMLKEHVHRVRNNIIQHVPVTSKTSYACLKCHKSFPAIARVHKHVKSHFPNNDPSPQVKPQTVKNSNDVTKTNSAVKSSGAKSVVKSSGAKSVVKSSGAKSVVKASSAKSNGTKSYNVKSNATNGYVVKSTKNNSIIISKAKEVVVEENLVQCEVCLQKFPTKGAYKMHMQTHTGEKPYLCSICKHAFARLATLKQHKALVHENTEEVYAKKKKTNEKKAVVNKVVENVVLQCRICKYPFQNEVNLRVHMLQHSGEESSDKPFECQYCHKRFIQSRCLSLHLRIHTEQGEKPLQCNLCDERFYWKYQVRDHVEEKHPLPAMFA